MSQRKVWSAWGEVVDAGAHLLNLQRLALHLRVLQQRLLDRIRRVAHICREFLIGTPHTRQGEERGVREVGNKGGGGRWCVRARTVLARGDHVVDHRVW